MLLPSSRAASPDVEEIMLLFDYSRIYTGIWGLKRISLSFVLILAAISSHIMVSSMNHSMVHLKKQARDASILICTSTATTLT